MAKRQVFRVAKELGVSSRELLDDLKEIGIEKPNNFSVLDDDEYELIQAFYQEKAGPQAPSPSPSPSPPVKAEAPGDGQVAERPEPEQGERTATAVVKEREGTQAQAEAVKAEPADKKPVGEPRPPVVAVLGHVDHGKTTLLDRIRKTHVAEQEAGGITQSIGAYQAEYQGKKITFIDTPGHRAFTGMRARGAQVTDIVILVVAADDGVMEQTKEAIAHARAAKVPIVVAINKIDKPGVDVNRVKQQLADEGLVPEDWGGDTITVPVSALTGQGIDELLEMILLVAELEDLRADPKGPVEGTIIESYLDPHKGPIATAIIKNGTLRERDVVVAGTAWGRIRALLDDQGRRVKEAPPGTPVQILGLSEVPPVGTRLEVVDSPAKAKRLVEERLEEQRRAKQKKARLTWEDVLAKTAQKGVLKLIVKADTLGSLEAVENELKRLETDVKVEFVHRGVGNVSESDVLLAASGEDDEEVGVVGFRVDVDPKARQLAEQEGVQVKTYEVIYDLADDVKRAIRRLLGPEYREVKLGEVEVRKVFKIKGVGTVAGCYVRDGKVTRDAHVRVRRGRQEIFTGRIQSLKRFDQDVREVGKGLECGLKIENFDDVQPGDRLEVFKLEEVEPV